MIYKSFVSLTSYHHVNVSLQGFKEDPMVGALFTESKSQGENLFQVLFRVNVGMYSLCFIGFEQMQCLMLHAFPNFSEHWMSF